MTETVIPHIASYSENIVQHLWLPCLIWTVLAASCRLILRILPDLHPQFHYHGRLAMILALPAGLAAVYALQAIESVWFAGAAEYSLALITLVSPVEISTVTITENPAQTVLWTEWIYAFFLLICISGMFFFAIRHLLQWLELSRLRRSLSLFEIDKLQNLDEVTSKIAAKYKYRILTGFTHKEPAPVTFGWFTPVILLPHSLKKGDEKRNLAIRHELIHITQNDFLSHCAVIITQLFFWFHPLIHLLSKELIDYREMRCDSLVLSSKDISPVKYASLLLELLPAPDAGKKLSVNMAQESSSLKKRIQMIAKYSTQSKLPQGTSVSVFTAILVCTSLAMACTDMQTQQMLDHENIHLLTDIDYSGTRGYHQILFFLNDEEQADRYLDALSQLQEFHPGHIMSVDVLKGDAAEEQYGERGENGVIKINTGLDEESYNRVLETLGMNKADLSLEDPYANKVIHYTADQNPELIGGLEAIQRRVRYPETARRAGIEGRVYVQFVVDEEGNAVYPRVTRGIGGGADEEALRVVSHAKFTPAFKNGRPVKIHYALPVFFELSDHEPETQRISALPEELEGALNVIGFVPLD
jgi:TonB family protein